MASTADRRLAEDAARATLAATYACDAADFDQPGLIVRVAAERPGRLRFPIPNKPLLLGTFGRGVVASVAAERVDWLRALLAGARRDEIFSAPLLTALVNGIAADGQTLAGPTLNHLCARSDLRPAAAPASVTLTLLERAEIPMLYRTPGFANALGYDEQHPRPDMLAVVARREADIVGIAAVSADSERLWQVGVDVVPEARGSGLGRALVSRLTAELLEREIVPFYATGIANIASRRLAASVGYWPAWTEVYARDLPAQ